MAPKDPTYVDWELLALESPLAVALQARELLKEGAVTNTFRGLRSRYLGLARTHLQHLLTATAMNIVRVIAWLRGAPLGERLRPPGHFARFSSHPLSRQTVLC